MSIYPEAERHSGSPRVEQEVDDALGQLWSAATSTMQGDEPELDELAKAVDTIRAALRVQAGGAAAGETHGGFKALSGTVMTLRPTVDGFRDQLGYEWILADDRDTPPAEWSAQTTFWRAVAALMSKRLYHIADHEHRHNAASAIASEVEALADRLRAEAAARPNMQVEFGNVVAEIAEYMRKLPTDEERQDVRDRLAGIYRAAMGDMGGAAADETEVQAERSLTLADEIVERLEIGRDHALDLLLERFDRVDAALLGAAVETPEPVAWMLEERYDSREWEKREAYFSESFAHVEAKALTTPTTQYRVRPLIYGPDALTHESESRPASTAPAAEEAE